jgi:cardiolipin synthase
MYTGSFNITAVHTRLHSEKAWKDIGVRVTGENVKFAVLNFKRMWKLRDYYRYKKQNRKIPFTLWKQSPLRLNHSLLMKSYFYHDLLKRIKTSQNRIWLTTPYFIPKRRIIRAIGMAAKRGVDVRILISSRSDVLLFRTLQFFYYPYLLKKGVHIFMYTDAVLHAKNFIIDGWTTVGSSNLNHRSFMHDLEVDLIIQDENNVKLIENDFINSTKPLNEVTPNLLKQRPIWDRFLARLFFLFKYWF